MDLSPYTIDRVDPHALSDAELDAVARLLQAMGAELLPEEPPRPLEAILARLRSNAPNQWNARVRARGTHAEAAHRHCPPVVPRRRPCNGGVVAQE